jgi:hypothetical protein
VPRKLAVLCCQQQLTSSAAAAAAWHVWWALDVLLTAAARDNIFHAADDVTAPTRRLIIEAQADTNALWSGIVQQLRQAGFFEHSVCTMLAAAQLLRAEADAVAAAESRSSNPAAASRKAPYLCFRVAEVALTLLLQLVFPEQEIDSQGWCATVGAAAEVALAGMRLLDAVAEAAPTAAAGAQTGAAAAGAHTAAAATAAAAAAQQQSGAADCLPWLVLLGRCFLLMAEQLQQLQQSKPDLAQLLLADDGRDPELSDHEWLGVLGVHRYHPIALVLDASFAAELATYRQCLTQGQPLQDLAAAGYPIQSVEQQLGAAAAALRVFPAADDPAATAAAYAGLVQQLRALGGVLNMLPVLHACNSPACVSMLGPSELAAVSGRGCVCGGCRVARYCSRACQRAAWKQHKPVCQALSPAAAAGATATAAAAAAAAAVSGGQAV